MTDPKLYLRVLPLRPSSGNNRELFKETHVSLAQQAFSPFAFLFGMVNLVDDLPGVATPVPRVSWPWTISFGCVAYFRIWEQARAKGAFCCLRMANNRGKEEEAHTI